jgi:hypothetical protein
MLREKSRKINIVFAGHRLPRFLLARLFPLPKLKERELLFGWENLVRFFLVLRPGGGLAMLFNVVA